MFTSASTRSGRKRWAPASSTEFRRISQKELEHDEEAERIGSGKYSHVTKACFNGETVAVKWIKRLDRSEKDFKTFEHAVSFFSRYSHRNIVKAYGECKTSTHNCLVLEYTPYGSLGDYLEKLYDECDSLSWGAFGYPVAYDIASALAYLHGRGIIHRDIKSENVLIFKASPDSNWPIAKLCDFGFAESYDERQQNTTCKGTFDFLPQEALRLQKLTVRSDTYAFGVLLWEMATLKHAWSELPTRREVFTSVTSGKTLATPEKAPELIQDIVKGCLFFDPSRRPASSDIAHRLAPFDPRRG